MPRRRTRVWRVLCQRAPHDAHQNPHHSRHDCHARVAGCSARAGSDAERHCQRHAGRRAARRHHHGHQRRVWQHVPRHHRRGGGLPHPAPDRDVSCDRRTRWVRYGDASGSAAAGRAAGNRRTANGSRHASGDRHRQRRSAVDRRRVVHGERQHRPAADAGPAAQRTQLARFDAAGARKPIQRGRRVADPPRPGRLPDQHGRPAGDQQHRRQQLRPAALQPRLDRGVRVRFEPIRRDAGTLDGRRRERRDKVGYQPAVGNVFVVLPRR